MYYLKVMVNVFVDQASAREFSKASLSGALFDWMEDRHVDGINFEFDPDSFQGDLDAAKGAVAFFTSVRQDSRWGNLTLCAMLPYGATLLLKDDLRSLLDFVFVRTHGLLDEPAGRTQLAAPLNDAGLVHRRSNVKTVMSLLEELEFGLNKRTCFTISLSGIGFTLQSPLLHGVGDPIKSEPLKRISFSETCDERAGRTKTVEDDAAYSSEGDLWVTHEDQFTVFEKIAKVLRHWHFLCVGVVDVDLDDVRGSCGRVYPLLRRVYETSYILKYF
ncbi:uncharacterized protein ISCGN_022262 [Ixodes scapularis]